ncbi:serine/threonine-protein kinase sepA-like [Dorcoceras hygrometricum]|uniref:Serine/threonine-protein kinase sepA-like n=1 Tax=Dorcoceras hygrometricum TaxID=472368 RepID=A0A2Z7C899_9LAMI|nr:serine/threonine-protein kinase sepA-like [Dorcoceras hygrometricum]
MRTGCATLGAACPLLCEALGARRSPRSRTMAHEDRPPRRALAALVAHLGRCAVCLPHDGSRRSAARWLDAAHLLRYTVANDDRWARDVVRGRASRLARRCAAASRKFRGAGAAGGRRPAKLRRCRDG